MISEDVQKRTNKIVKWIGEHGEFVVQKLINLIKKIISFLKDAYAFITPYGEDAAELYMFLVDNYINLERQLVILENERINNSND